MSLVDDLKKIAGMKPRFSHVERELATAYGLAPDALKTVRSAQLQRGRDWDLVKGLVCYNDAGKAALEAALAITAEKNPAAEPVAAPPAEPPAAEPDSAPNIEPAAAVAAPQKFAAVQPGEVRTLVAVAKVRNKRILKARDEDRVAWVRVKDSKNFRAGMSFQATFMSGDQWELVGRCPRWNGKF